MREKKRGGEEGFTLLELLIAVTLSVVVAGGIYSVYVSGVKTRASQERQLAMQQNLRAAMYLMGRDIRMAGYQGMNRGNIRVATVTGAMAGSFQFTRVSDTDGIDNDNDGEIDEFNELSTIGYAFYDADGDGLADDIGRTLDGTRSLVAENMEGMDFLYVQSNGTETYTPAVLNNVVGVRLTLLARSSKAEAGYTDTSVYVCPAPSGGTARVWGPFNDGFHRRLLTGTFLMRNMRS